jgi:membrane protein
MKSIYALLKTSVSQWTDDFASSMGAALSYYTVFSIAPLLVIAIAVAALVFGQSVAQHEVLDQLRGLLGPEGANAVESMLVSAQKPKEGILAGALSIVTLLIGATTVFNELESDLNRIWRVPAQKRSGVWNLLRTRLLSFGMVVSVGFLLLVSLIASAALAAWGKYWSGWFFGIELALQAANLLLSLAVFTLFFALMYKVLPRVRIAWRDVWIGAIVTSLLFTMGKFLIGLYIGRASVASSYGAAGALVVLLLWVYYSSQVLLFGAEFTRAYAESHGSRRQNPTVEEPSIGPATNRVGAL